MKSEVAEEDIKERANKKRDEELRKEVERIQPEIERLTIAFLKLNKREDGTFRRVRSDIIQKKLGIVSSNSAEGIALRQFLGSRHDNDGGEIKCGFKDGDNRWYYYGEPRKPLEPVKNSLSAPNSSSSFPWTIIVIIVIILLIAFMLK